MKLYSPAVIAAIKDKYEFQFTKSLGQNFLIDQNIIDNIIEGTCIEKEDLVIEIGPGMGVLTAAAAQSAGKVVAVEIDRKLIPILHDTLKEYNNIEIIHRDILKTDLAEIIRQNENINGKPCRSVAIIGNLPYYITTPIIMKILEEGIPAHRLTIMLQKEVADRIQAVPGTKACGAISASVQYYCQVTHLFNVPKEAFVPRPGVDSAVLRLDIRKEKSVEVQEESLFFSCIKMGFGQRRKTLQNALAGIGGLEKSALSKALANAEIDGMRRGETLSLQEFARLSNEIKKVGDK